MQDQVQEQAQTPTVPVVPPQYICVLDDDVRSRAFAERFSELKLRVCPNAESMRTFVGDVGAGAVVVMFDTTTAATFPVRFHERSMHKVAERVPAHLLSTGGVYFVELGNLVARKTDRTSHVASMLRAAFVTDFLARTANGEFPWGKKPGTGRKVKQSKFGRSRRGFREGYGLVRPYVHP